MNCFQSSECPVQRVPFLCLFNLPASDPGFHIFSDVLLAHTHFIIDVAYVRTMRNTFVSDALSSQRKNTISEHGHRLAYETLRAYLDRVRRVTNYKTAHACNTNSRAFVGSAFSNVGQVLSQSNARTHARRTHARAHAHTLTHTTN